MILSNRNQWRSIGINPNNSIVLTLAQVENISHFWYIYRLPVLSNKFTYKFRWGLTWLETISKYSHCYLKHLSYCVFLDRSLQCSLGALDRMFSLPFYSV